MSASAQDEAKKAIGDAQQLIRQGQANSAVALLLEAAQRNPKHHDLQLNIAMAQRARGDLTAAVRALNQALVIEPYSFLALLSKGSVLEQMGRRRGAAEAYRNAVRIAPVDAELPPSLKAPLENAKSLIEEQAQAMAAHFQAALAPVLESHAQDSLDRFRECVDVLAGTKPIYNAEPIQLHYPRLPAIPFFDREYFPWMDTLEAATDTIRGELMTLLEAGLPGFAPYVQYGPGTPENQFARLNHSSKWSSLWLWKDGQPQAEAMAQCPKTTAILKSLPLADQPEFAPTALFSALAPRTRIPPHTGSTNTRLLVHLPLVLPGPAGFRVGNDVRNWEMGKAWAFDDTIEHEAWNDADETRVIMIFDIWNPLLNAAERELVSQLLLTHRDWLDESTH